MKLLSFDLDLICLPMQLEVPKELITTKQLQELMLLRRPSFLSVGPDVNQTKVYDAETGIMQRRLSNGIPVNYKVKLHIHAKMPQS